MNVASPAESRNAKQQGGRNFRGWASNYEDAELAAFPEGEIAIAVR